MDLESVADELYALVPSVFVSNRDRLAQEARRAGDKELASSIARLRRPTVAAWLSNALVRRRPAEISELLAVGDGLRKAQFELSGPDLRRLSDERRRMISVLVESARNIAGSAGQPVTEQVTRDLEVTLEAAVADSVAGQALVSGRLTTALSFSGFGDAERGHAHVVPSGDVPSSSADGTSKSSQPARKDVNPRARHAERLRREAKVALEQVNATLSDLSQEAANKERVAVNAADQHQRLLKRITDLEDRLVAMRASAGQAERHGREARRAAEEAKIRLARARSRADEAKRALDDLA